jgi:tyrosyl-tRNA synthetase
MGGSDQWGNITAGIDLIRKSLSRSAFGATWPLVTKSDGTKFGKTASGAVWLDAHRTTPYQFRQFWIQMPDADVVKYLPQFSLASMEEVQAVIHTHESDPGRRTAQRFLAQEITTLVHGSHAAHEAESAAEILFGGNPVTASREAIAVVAAEVPTSIISRADLDDSYAALTTAGVVTSNSDARRSVEQKGIKVNGAVLEPGESLASKGFLHDRWVLVRKGKTSYHLFDVAS